MVIFDIGCNNGQWIDSNLSVYPGATFIGVEANPKTYKKVSDKFKGCRNIKIINRLAASVDNRQIHFYPEVNDPSAVASSASLEWIKKGRFAGVCGWPEPVLIESITLESMINTYGEPEHIKIDVEGYELMVLRGLKHKSGSISFEWVEEQKDKLITSVLYLNKLSYRGFNWLVNSDSYDYRPDEYCEAGEMIDIINCTLDAKEKIKWGMVYAI